MGGRAGLEVVPPHMSISFFIIVFNTKDFAKHVWFNPGLPTILWDCPGGGRGVT